MDRHLPADSLPQPSTIVLSIGGSDSSAGAGIQADIKTLSALGVYASTAITAVTAQNSQGISSIEALSPSIVTQQISAVLDDLDVKAIKIGMLYNEEIIDTVYQCLKSLNIPIVIDPVMLSSSGTSLLSDTALTALKETLFPLAALITPNLNEAAVLLNTKPANNIGAMKEQAQQLASLYSTAILLKGGHLPHTNSADIFIASSGSSSINSSIRAVAMGSKAEHGSSMRITSGSTAIALAMHKRCC